MPDSIAIHELEGNTTKTLLGKEVNGNPMIMLSKCEASTWSLKFLMGREITEHSDEKDGLAR